jgi:hypothetical protein
MIFLLPAGMSLTKLSPAGNNSIFPGQGEFGKYIPAGEGKIANLFYSVGDRSRLNTAEDH